MCGITGIVGQPPADRSTIERMTALLHHRGPDDRGIWTSNEAHLGHTRLSILDLSAAGHQPMELGDLVLTYNGEIYNFRKLRTALPGPWRSDSDSEVLLHLYREYGPDCVNHLQGMFAFAIWDRANRRLFAARDRLGIKPFLYRQDGDGFAFASELKCLLELGRPALEPHAISDFLTYRYIPTPKSIFAGIHKLPPAHTLVWEDGRVEIDRYWTPDASPGVFDMDEALEELDHLLQEVVPEHEIADVPVGVFLSGGIDSATMTYFLDNPSTFTLGTDVAHRNEAPAARRVAEHLGTKHHEEVAGAVDLVQALDAMPGLYDEPFGDSGAWSSYLVSELARRHVTVALSGEGGDELFLGYKRHGLWTRSQPSALTRLLARLLPPLTDTGRSMHRRSQVGFDRYAELSSSFTRQQKRALLTQPYQDREYDDLWYFRQHWREDLAPLQRVRWLDLHTYLPDDLLTKVDRASMAHSLEVRPPLLDHRLVEFALKLDPTMLRSADGKKGKLILRRLMEDRLPPGHLDEPKRGFNLPIRRWVAKNSAVYRSALDRLTEAGIIKRQRVMHVGGEQTWALLVLDRWLHC